MGGLRKGWIKAPGANIGDVIALFEATHSIALRYTGQDKVNFASLVRCGCMMFEYLGWRNATDLISNGISITIQQKRVTYDLERPMQGATLLKCCEFGSAIVENM